MIRILRSPAVALLFATASVQADEGQAAGRRASSPEKPSWEFAVTAYPTLVRGGDDYTTGIGVANRGPLHIEGRVNYESVGARSVFAGWTMSGGETVRWELTPLLGGAWGATRAVVPALEVSAAWRGFDYYIEAEYVRDTAKRTDSYFYAWTEAAYRPTDWLRGGFAGQRTRAYHSERELHRGPFLQLTWRRLTLGAYWFNPGSSEQVFVGAIAASF